MSKPENPFRCFNSSPEVIRMAVMLYIRFWTDIAWTWYVFIGSVITLAAAWLASFAFAPAPDARQGELAPGLSRE